MIDGIKSLQSIAGVEVKLSYETKFKRVTTSVFPIVSAGMSRVQVSVSADLCGKIFGRTTLKILIKKCKKDAELRKIFTPPPSPWDLYYP